jgi:hypothetical protein
LISGLKTLPGVSKTRAGRLTFDSGLSARDGEPLPIDIKTCHRSSATFPDTRQFYFYVSKMSGLSTFIEGRSPSVLAIVALSGAYVLYSLINRFISYQRQSKIIKENGCKPYAKYPHKDPIFGFDLFKENVRLTKEGGIWLATQKRYATVNGGVNTFSQLLLGEEVINTAEPENIKAILATQFKDFSLPPRRKESFHPVFGHGIFTTDGAEWEASRTLLRPNFVRNQIADLRTFEDHISRMISKIPRDGSTVDLQTLFFMLTIDSGKLKLDVHNKHCR